MTKKHFEAVAESVKNTNFETPKDKFKFVRSLCSFFQSENENFDKQKFAKACHSEEELMSKSEIQRVTNIV